MSTDRKLKITQEYIRSLLDGEGILLESGKRSFYANNVNEAISTLRALIYLNKDHIEGNYFLAAAYRRNGEVEEASKTLAQVKELFPEEFKELEYLHSFFLAESRSDVTEQAREFAYSFIKKHFKEELPLFEIFFNSVKELVSLDQLQTKNLVGALGMADKEDILKTYKSPVIIKSAIDTFKGINIKERSEKELIGSFKENLAKNKALPDILIKTEKE